MQNTSHAVMSQRVEGKESLDDFPTPPWATRALADVILGGADHVGVLSALEPACGRGHMAQALGEYFAEVAASDVHDYHYGAVRDFLSPHYEPNSFDWVITNPPFRLAEQFIFQALPLARQGVAVLVRTVFMESVGRYERLFSVRHPSKVVQFTERVPMVKGRIDKKASTATGYSWVIWEHDHVGPTEFAWVPPCRKRLEKSDDYDQSYTDAEEDKAPVPQRELFG